MYLCYIFSSRVLAPPSMSVARWLAAFNRRRITDFFRACFNFQFGRLSRFYWSFIHMYCNRKWS